MKTCGKCKGKHLTTDDVECPMNERHYLPQLQDLQQQRIGYQNASLLQEKAKLQLDQKIDRPKIGHEIKNYNMPRKMSHSKLLEIVRPVGQICLHLSKKKPSLADQAKEDGNPRLLLPVPKETFKNGVKIIAEYKYNEDNKKVKMVRHYMTKKHIFVSKTIAERRTWQKFGDSANDKPGPNPKTTSMAENVNMQYILTNKQDDTDINKLEEMDHENVMKCRNCKGDHWTTKCPYEDRVAEEKKSTTIGGLNKNDSGSKYVPQNLQEGAKNTDSSLSHCRRDDTLAIRGIRISNLSENTQEADLENLVKPFGPYSKLYLAKDRITKCCKGYAYVHFIFRGDAAKAIANLDGFSCDHLILSVDWTKPSKNYTLKGPLIKYSRLN